MSETVIWFSLIFIKGDIVIFKELLINEQITSPEIRLIGAKGEQFGIISRSEAIKMAQDANLDLVMMSGGNPAVCKILDYGKYKFDAIKREKELRKNQKVSELKEIQLSMTIDKRDLEIKAKKGAEFLTAGNKVKVALRMSGRQQAFASRAKEVVKSFAEMLSSLGTPDKEPEIIGRNIIMIISPKK